MTAQAEIIAMDQFDLGDKWTFKFIEFNIA